MPTTARRRPWYRLARYCLVTRWRERAVRAAVTASTPSTDDPRMHRTGEARMHRTGEARRSQNGGRW